MAGRQPGDINSWLHEIEFAVSRRQLPRGSLPDFQSDKEMCLFKNVTELRATYQIRLLLYRAVSEGKKLIVEVPEACVLSAPLAELTEKYSEHLEISRV